MKQTCRSRCWAFALVLAVVGPAGSASAGTPEMLEEVSTDVSIGADGEFVVELALNSNEFQAETLELGASVTKGWEARVASRTLELGDAPGAVEPIRVSLLRGEDSQSGEGDYVVLKVMAQGARQRQFATKVYMQVASGNLELRTAAEYLESMEAEPGIAASLRFTGTIVPYEDVASPYDLPGISDAEAAALIASMEQTEGRSGALGASTNDGHDRASSAGESGCVGGSTLSFSLLGLLGVCWRRVRRAAVASLLIVAGVGVNEASASVCGYGTLAFWDYRAIRGGATCDTNNTCELHYVDYGSGSGTGWRLRECNTGTTTCAPSDANCCFSALAGVEITLWKSTGGGPYTQVTPFSVYGPLSTGYFSICDTNALGPGPSYRIRVSYRSNSATPTLFEVEPSVGGSAFYTDINVTGMANPFGSLGQINVTSASDTTSTGADVVTLYSAMYDTLAAFEADGETRHQKKFSSAAGTRDLIECQYNGTPGGTTTSDSMIQVGAARTHGDYTGHELGHILTWRALNRALPANNPANIAPQKISSSEGISLNEAFPQFTAILSQFDPQAATMSDLLTNYTTCWVDVSASTNQASNGYNNALGFWELLDSDTGNNQNSRSDNTDVTLEDLVDAMLGLDGNSSSSNRGINEGTYTNTFTGCQVAGDCATAGQVCNQLGGSGNCFSGDVHGENIRDWAHFLPGGSTTPNSTTYEDTLISCQCLGVIDDSTTGGFTGGFRSD